MMRRLSTLVPARWTYFDCIVLVAMIAGLATMGVAVWAETFIAIVERPPL